MSVHSEKETTEPDNINIGLIATVTIVGALLVLAIALALTALVRSESSSRGNLVGVNADLGTVRRLKAEQRAKLEATAAWLDRAKGQVAVPIDRAMEMVTADIRRDPNLATAISTTQVAAPALEPAPPGAPALAPPGAPALVPAPAKVVAPAPTAAAITPVPAAAAKVVAAAPAAAAKAPAPPAVAAVKAPAPPAAAAVKAPAPPASPPVAPAPGK